MVVPSDTNGDTNLYEYHRHPFAIADGTSGGANNPGYAKLHVASNNCFVVSTHTADNKAPFGPFDVTSASLNIYFKFDKLETYYAHMTFGANDTPDNPDTTYEVGGGDWSSEQAGTPTPRPAAFFRITTDNEVGVREPFRVTFTFTGENHKGTQFGAEGFDVADMEASYSGRSCHELTRPISGWMRPVRRIAHRWTGCSTKRCASKSLRAQPGPSTRTNTKSHEFAPDVAASAS